MIKIKPKVQFEKLNKSDLQTQPEENLIFDVDESVPGPSSNRQKTTESVVNVHLQTNLDYIKGRNCRL
ncbi:hypothetical protein BpHYR1_020416, partial [Brachionus plicatilis]